ncbi:MAG: hypothetical protein KDD26_02150 [Winogradskyella sp.]|nr:hypothetical protein [Winogradskyella sp.]
MEIFAVDRDLVIDGYFATGRVTYKYAIDNLIELTDKLHFQRKLQNERFYSRLEIDIQEGCIMPAITIAFVDDVVIENKPTIKQINELISVRIKNSFILDGIQRLNTLKRIAKKETSKLDTERFMYVNVIVCPSKDNLLYRMVTLNNGQKPMTARHQIEMLASTLYEFKGFGIDVYSEKETQGIRPKRAFKKSDLINAYIAFLSNTTNLDNKKIIEEKLDELVARKIIEYKLPNVGYDFSSVLQLLGRLSQSEYVETWLRNGNNLMGFVVALRTKFLEFKDMPVDQIKAAIEKYETAFKNINVSKIKLSRERRKLAAFYFSNFESLSHLDSDELTLEIGEEA